MNENTRSVLIKINTGISFWVPKQFIDSHYAVNKGFLQEFLIEKWILKKIGFDLNKN